MEACPAVETNRQLAEVNWREFQPQFKHYSKSVKYEDESSERSEKQSDKGVLGERILRLNPSEEIVVENRKDKSTASETVSEVDTLDDKLL